MSVYIYQFKRKVEKLHYYLLNNNCIIKEFDMGILNDSLRVEQLV